MKNGLKFFSELFCIALIGIFLSSCAKDGSKPYREMKSLLTEYKAKVEGVHNMQELRELGDEYQPKIEKLDKSISQNGDDKMTAAEQKEIKKLSKNVGLAIQNKLIGFADQ